MSVRFLQAVEGNEVVGREDGVPLIQISQFKVMDGGIGHGILPKPLLNRVHCLGDLLMLLVVFVIGKEFRLHRLGRNHQLFRPYRQGPDIQLPIPILQKALVAVESKLGRILGGIGEVDEGSRVKEVRSADIHIDGHRRVIAIDQAAGDILSKGEEALVDLIVIHQVPPESIAVANRLDGGLEVIIGDRGRVEAVGKDPQFPPIDAKQGLDKRKICLSQVPNRQNPVLHELLRRLTANEEEVADG